MKLSILSLAALLLCGCRTVNGEVLVKGTAMEGYWFEKCPCGGERKVHQSRGPIGTFCQVDVILGIVEVYHNCHVRRLAPEDWRLDQALPEVHYVTDQEADYLEHPEHRPPPLDPDHQ